MYTVCPHALVFGIWDSTGPKGGLGAKFQRVLVSEIVGFGAVTGAKTASRIDPAGIERGATVYQSAQTSGAWEADEALARKDKKSKPVTVGKDGRPSEINHGNVAPSIDTQAGGVTLDYAQQTTVLSLVGLRQLRFPTNSSGEPFARQELKAAQVAARTCLAALALAAIVYARRSGFHLRSRALLIPEGPLHLEALDVDGGPPTSYTLDTSGAAELLGQAAAQAAERGLAWTTTPITLRPAPKLVALITKSRALAAAKAEAE